MILLGGSLTSRPVDDLIHAIKDSTDCPVFLFPGNLFQLSDKADGILLEARPMWERAHAALLKDPLAFVDRKA